MRCLLIQPASSILCACDFVPAIKSCRSVRASGSPPVKCTCRTPNLAASEKTRSQSFAGNSALAEASSMGFEQYTQCSGQRCVISAMRANGFESIRNQDIKKSKRQKSRSKINNAFVVQLLEKATSVRADDCGVGFGVLLLQFRDEFCERALAIAQLQNSLSRALNPDGAFRK